MRIKKEKLIKNAISLRFFQAHKLWKKQ